MKRFLSFFLLVVLLFLIGCDKTTATPTIALNGESTITLSVGEAYYEQGAYASNVESVVDITIGGDTVNIFEAGTYIVTYTFTYEGVDYQITRQVIVVSNEVTFTLNGDEHIYLNVGDSYSDPGYSISDSSITVTVTGSVTTTSVPGEFIIYYDATINGSEVRLTRIVTIESTTEETTFYMIGNAVLNYTVGDVYTDLGYYISDSSIQVSVTGSVNTSIAGMYTVTYSAMIDGELVSLSRVVYVKAAAINFYLIGDDTVYLSVGDIYSDPGYYISDTTIQVQMSTDVDTSQTGVYTVTYYVVNQAELYLQRTVIVGGSHTYFQVVSTSLNGDWYEIVINNLDTNYHYMYFYVELYQDEILYEQNYIGSGQSTFIFTELPVGYTYKVQVRGEYMDGSILKEDIEVIESFTLSIEDIYPSISISNELIDGYSYGFQYEITNPSNFYITVNFDLFLNDMWVDSTITSSNLTDSISFTSLSSQREYKVIANIQYEYDYQTITQTEEWTFTTLFDFQATPDSNIQFFEGTTSYISMSVNNPNDYTLISFKAGTDVYTILNMSSSLIEFAVDISTIGTHTISIDTIIIDRDGYAEEIPFSLDVTYEVVAHAIEPALISFNSDDPEKYVMSEYDYIDYIAVFYNPGNYVIKDIVLTNIQGDRTITSFYILENDGEVVRFLDYSNEEVRLTAFSYEYNGVTYTVNVTKNNVDFVDYIPDTIHEIRTATEFLDMVQLGYGNYQLMNDISLVQAFSDWTSYISGFTCNGITLYGNNHTITLNLSTHDIASSSTTYWGLFPTLFNSHIEDLNIVFYSTLGNSTYKTTYVGGLAGKIEYSYIENVNVTGSIEPYYYFGDGALGGLAGLSRENVIQNVHTDVHFGNIDSLHPTTKFTLGGIVGESHNDEFYRVSAENTIQFVSVSSTYRSYISMGGLFGTIENTIVEDAYHFGTTKDNLTGMYSGGIAGQVTGSSILNRVYSSRGIDGDGLYLGGLVGYNTGVISNSFVAAYVNSDNATPGYIAGLNYGTYTNNYYESSVIVQNNLSTTSASDINNSELHSFTSSETTNQAFFEAMYYYDLIYDYSLLSSTNLYPKFYS